MVHTPDIFTYGNVIQAEHIECEVKLEFQYNGIFGVCTVRARREINRLLSNDINNVYNVDTLRRISLNVGKRNLVLFLYENNRYDIFSGCLGTLHRCVRKRGTYDSIFQPFYGKGGWVVYGDTRNNLDRAVAARVANKRDNEEVLKFNHSKLSLFGRGVARVRLSVFTKIKRRLHNILATLGDDLVERARFAEKKCAKRRLKIQALVDVLNAADTGLFVTYIRGKLKLYEKAKPGKNPRLIGDYTTPGSILAGYLCEYAKSAFIGCDDAYSEHGFNVCGMYSEFVKSTDADTLRRVGEMLASDNRNQHFHHSDDSLLKIDGKLYELDISSCDSSNGSPIFDIILWLFEGTQYYDVIDRCVSQCKLPLKLRDPCNFISSVKLQTIRPFEFSGSTLTTLLNEIASTMIGIQISYDKSMTPDAVIQSAIAVGYNVTLVPRENMSQATLLKNSWWNGESFLNLGAILRSFGTFSGDLPGSAKVPLSIRCEDFCSSLVVAYKHCGSTSVYKALARRYVYHTGYYDSVVIDKLSYSYDNSIKRGDVDDAALIARYGVSQPEIDELCHYIVSRDMFQHISLPIIDKIYEVDYGLKYQRHRAA